MAAEEGQLTDAQWVAIANDFMKDMDFTEDGGKAPAQWVSVRHGPSKNGNDHIHIVASMVRDDGTKWNSWKSKYKSQQAALLKGKGRPTGTPLDQDQTGQ